MASQTSNCNLHALLIQADCHDQRYYNINKFFLSSIGQWPYQSQRQRLTALAIFLFLASSQIIPQTIAFVKYRDDRNIVIESLPPFAIDAICAVKLITLFVNTNKMLELCKHIETDWIFLAQQPEVHILREYAETGRQFTIGYAVGIYVITVLFMTQPAFPKILEVVKLANKSEPGKFASPVDYYAIDMETYYFYLILLSCICVSAILTVFVAADTLFIVQVQHNCAMFAVVGCRMQKLGGEISKDWGSYSRPADDPAFRHLTICIKLHNKVIEFSDILESCYAWSLFATVGLNMLLISVSGFQILLIMSERPQDTIRWAAFIMAQLLHLFFQSFFAQKMSDHSQQVREKLYQSEWYRSTLYGQKLLGLISIRSSVPCQMTAGKFFVMSLQNFTSVVKTSISYFTLLRSMQ